MAYPIPSDPLIPRSNTRRDHSLHPWCQGYEGASYCAFSSSRNSEC